MKKVLIIACLSFLSLSETAEAVDSDSAVVHITGNIKAGTCKPNDKVVDFKDVERSSFSGAGTSGPTQEFEIELTDCSSDITKISMKASGEADKNYSGFFGTKKDDGSADNLAVKITHNEVDIDPSGSSDVSFSPKDGSVKEKFTATLIQDSETLPELGAFSSTITLSFEYL